MSETALEKIDPGALAALMTPEEIADFNADFSAGMAAEYLPQLSIRGGKWRLRIGGTEEVVPGQSINVHLIGSRPCISKSFYVGGYDPKAEQKGPDCSSLDGQYPDSNIQAPQAPNCQICENNAWGSKGGGSKGKACSDYKQIVVTLDIAPETPLGLRIPPSSFKPFNSYIQKLKMANAPANAAVTKLTLGDEEYPTIAFDFGGLVDRARFEKLKEIAASAEVTNVIKIQARAEKALPPAAPEVSAQQPVVVETPVPIEEPAPVETSNALANLLAGKAAPKPRKKKEKPVEETVVEVAPELAATPDKTPEPITNIDSLLAKLNQAKNA